MRIQTWRQLCNCMHLWPETDRVRLPLVSMVRVREPERFLFSVHSSGNDSEDHVQSKITKPRHSGRLRQRTWDGGAMNQGNPQHPGSSREERASGRLMGGAYL